MNTVLRQVLLLAVPLVLAIALFTHPVGGSEIFEDVREDVDAWLFVHTALLLITPLLGIAAFYVLRGLEGRAARVSRVALVFFLVFYTAYEVTVGLGTGVLVDYANGLPAAEQAAVADAIQHYNGNAILADPSISLVLGGFGWVVAMLAAAVAFRRAGASWPTTLLVGSPLCSRSTRRRPGRSGSPASARPRCCSRARGRAVFPAAQAAPSAG